MKKALVALIGIAIAIAIGHYLYTQMSVMMPTDGSKAGSSSSSEAGMFESSSSSAAMMEGSASVKVSN